MILEQMRELANLGTVKALLAMVWAWLMESVGHPGSAARFLFWLMLIDLALGLGRAWRLKDLRSARLAAGALKFFWYWVAVAVFVLAENAISVAMVLPLSLRDTFIAYLAINEALSCVEHLAFFGMPVPDVFLKRLQKYRDSLGGSGGWDGQERRAGKEE